MLVGSFGALLLLLAQPAAAQIVGEQAAAAQQAGQRLEPAVEARLSRMVEQFRFDRKLTNFSSYPIWVPGEDRLVYWVTPAPGEGRWVSLEAATGMKTTLIEPADLRSQLASHLGQSVTLPTGIGYAVEPGTGAVNFLLGGKAFSLDPATRRVVPLPAESMEALAVDPSNRLAPARDMAARPTQGGFDVVDRSGRLLFAAKPEEHYEWMLPAQPWSPDGGVLLAWRIDARQVHMLPVVEYEGALERVRHVPYAKAGTPIEVPELHLIDPRKGEARRITFTDAEGYAFLAGWREGAGEALILHLSRDGKRLDLYGVSAASGQSRLILREERPETFVGDLGFIIGGWARQVTPLKRGFLWMSERDGWRHVYRYNDDGKLVGQVTRGAFPVHEIAAVAPDERTISVIASANQAAPYDRLPYRVAMGGGRLQPLAKEPGVHRVHFSSTGRYFADAFSTREHPTIRSVAAADGSRSRRYEAWDATALRAWGFRPPEAFVARAADGTTPIHGVIYKPHDFDPTRKYPVVEYIYGGPFTTAVPHDFLGSADSRMAAGFAQAGFVVVVVDSPGTPGRGKAFQDATYGRIGQVEIRDHVGAVRQAAATRPYMDLRRVGIAGYSWGGYFALRGMLTAPDFYRAGYSGSPGELTEMAMVNEPNMGLPSRNPEGYRRGSNIAAAGQLQGALKIMHGTADTDAPISTTMLMADALIAAGKRFELLVIPGAGHNLAPRQWEYGARDIALFFMKELGEPRP